MTATELRGAPRFTVHGVKVRLASVFGQLVNVSATGALIRVSEKLPVGSECPLVLYVRPEAVELRTRVVRLVEPVSIEPGATLEHPVYAIGVTFLEPAPPARQAIAQLCGHA